MATQSEPEDNLTVPKRVQDLPELFLQAESKRVRSLITTASRRKSGDSTAAIIHIPEAAPGFDHNGLEKA